MMSGVHRRRRAALVRADAGLSIGMGHVFRSLALADELSRRGWEVTVASRGLSASLEHSIRRRGHRLVAPAVVSTEADAEHLATLMPAGGVDLAIVDHYGIDARWHRSARRWAGTIVAIDDLADRELDVDIVLNQNLGESESRYDGKVPTSAVRLIGPRYALLREQFATRRGRGPAVRTSVKRILVALSGADEHDVTRIAAEAAAASGVATDVVVGAAYPQFEGLRAWASSVANVSLHREVTEMADLMRSADLAVGAPGSASWERCCLGLPAIVIVLAENQIAAGRALDEAGAALNLGWHSQVDGVKIAAAVQHLVGDPQRLARLSQAAASVTDGRGAQRAADRIEQLSGGGPTI